MSSFVSRRIMLGAALAATAPTAALAFAPDRERRRDRDRDRDDDKADDQTPLAVIPGPKRTIAVGDIDVGRIAVGVDVAAALSAQLTRELTNCGRFVVVERNEMSDLQNERQLIASRAQATPGGAGRLIAARYLVVGQLTQFGTPDSGTSLRIGGLAGGFIDGAAISRQTGKVKIELRILDTRSTEVISAFQVGGEASRMAVGLTGAGNDGDATLKLFDRTPMGEASAKAMAKAVRKIVDALAATQWEGRVVAWDEGTVVVNAGADAGMTPGSRLRVERVGNVFTDPDTGQILGEQRMTIGEVVITSVQPKMAFGQFMPGAGAAEPKRGDAVLLSSAAIP